MSHKRIKDNRTEQDIESAVKFANSVKNQVLFSFKYYLDKDKRLLQNCTYRVEDVFQRFSEISLHSWDECMKSDHHSMIGCETISFDQFNQPNQLPAALEDVKNGKMYVFRIDGANHAMVGIRQYNVFYVLLVEKDFGDAYNHN